MAHKEAKRISLGTPPFTVQDLMVICVMDNILITQVLPIIDDMEVVTEMDNVEMSLAVGGVKPNMLLVF